MATGSSHSSSSHEPAGKLRYAVVGLGHIAQAAVLPAFRHAAENSELAALVSGDPEKLRLLGKRYKVRHTASYDEYEAYLRSGDVDAVYIALPNHLHCEYAVRAAEAGCHVLCEKPMALTEAECVQMIEAAARNGVRLMVAYRLHFEEANLQAIETALSGQIGEPRYFESSFSLQVAEGNIRLRRETGGGTLFDIGIYCINAARSLFRDEPVEAFCTTTRGNEGRFAEVEEGAACVLRFPNDRLASFTCSFGAAGVSAYRIAGTRGQLLVEPAYDYQARLAHHVTTDGQTKKRSFSKRDQFAPELLYFSQCVLEGRDPAPGGTEGLADLRVIQALYRSAMMGRPVRLEPTAQPARPIPEQEIHRPAVSEPELVNVESPSE